MPVEECRVWSRKGISWEAQRSAGEGVVITAVLIVFADAAAHLNPQVRPDAQIPGVEKRVEVLPQQEPVVKTMLALLAIRNDVGGIQGRESSLGGNRTSAFVRVGDCNPELALAETPGNQDWCAVTVLRDGRWCDGDRGRLDLPPYPGTDRGSVVVCLP
jgi:hypothetical protein